jgi:molecular chaperone GrpE
MTDRAPSNRFSLDELRLQAVLTDALADKDAEIEEQRATVTTLVAAVVQALDSVDRLLEATSDGDDGGGAAGQRYRNSVRLIGRQLLTSVRATGFDVLGEVGEAIEPATHHVVGTKETATTDEGVVVEVLRRGYRFADRVVRAADVIVAVRPPVTEGGATNDNGTDSEGDNGADGGSHSDNGEQS